MNLVTPTVFISYKWQDAARNQWVETLCNDLRERYGVDAKLDQYEVDLGESFSDYMTRQIDRECTAMLFIITPAAVLAVDESKSGAINFEMQLANARRMRGGFRIIGVYREGSDNTAYLRDHRYIDFRHDEHYDNNLKVLADSLWKRRRKPDLNARAEAVSDIWDSIGLTARQKEVAELVIRGALYKQIAYRLGITQATVAKHVAQIFVKANVQGRNELAARVLGVDPDDVSARLGFPRRE